MKRVSRLPLRQAACWAFLSLAIFNASIACGGEVTQHPHVVIIMLDDLGYGDLGCFNPNSRIATPNIDRLSQQGMRFTDAHAPGPLCHLSRYGLLTGRYPFRTNVGVWSRSAVIEEDRMTIASMLKSQGYRTEMVGKWHLGFDEQGYDKPLPGGPVDRGFDRFFGIRASTDIPPYFYIKNNQAVAPPTDTIEAKSTEGWSPIQGEFWRAGGIAPGMRLHDVLPRFTEEAEIVMREHAELREEQPLFLYLAYPAPHTPWLPSEEFSGKSDVPLYGDFTMMVDHMVGRVLDTLRETGLAENALVILTSDNGPVWYESDVERYGHDSSGPWRGMKADAWEAGHRMPFIVRWPGHIEEGSAVSDTICFTDVMATLAAVVDFDLPKEAGPDSFDLLPVLLGNHSGNEPIRGPIVMRSGGGMMTIRSGEWKLIDAVGSGGFSQPRRIKPEEGEPTGQLYQLADDPQEMNNLYLSQSEVVEKLRQLMEKIIATEPSNHRFDNTRD